MKLRCPHCGRRPVEEFRYADLPEVPRWLTDPAERDLDRVFNKTNRFGLSPEAWFHEAGCRRWFQIERDTSQ